MIRHLRLRRLVGAHRAGLDLRGTAIQYLTITAGISLVVYGFMYAGPSQWVRNVRPPQLAGAPPQNNIVINIESLGPYWPILFGTVGIAVIVTAILCRGVVISIGLATGVWAFYGLCILIGAILTEPPTPLLAGFQALLFSALHFWLARHWAEEGVK